MVDMRIVLNMLYVAPGLAGGRVYADGLLRGLASLDSNDAYVIFTRRDISLPALPDDRFRQVCAPISGPSTVWRTLWEYGLLPSKARRRCCDLFHGLGSLSPATRSCPFILTIHDVIYRHFPQSVSLPDRWFRRLVHPNVARKADRVIVPSRCSAQEVVEHLGVKEGQVRIVPYGPGNAFERITDEAILTATLAKYKLRRPYIISVCRGYAHKNLAGLLEAMAQLRARGWRDVQLVLVGERYRSGHTVDQLTRRLGLEETVVFTGFASQEDLRALYSAASVFAFPSLAEGFGLPLLEAMACGTPIVSSNASAMPEAVGSAGLLADARNPEAFAAALARLLDDESLQAALRTRGYERVREFSWQRCAAQTLAVYREVA
jgi:glycosyltransferase involved in cell wall biosynthesis